MAGTWHIVASTGATVTGTAGGSAVDIPDVTEVAVLSVTPVDVSGTLKADIACQCRQPAVPGTGSASFEGVRPYLQIGSFKQDHGWVRPANNVIEASVLMTFTLQVDYPIDGATWKLWVPSCHDSENIDPIIEAATPSADVIIPAFSATAIPDVIQFHAGDNRTGSWLAQMYSPDDQFRHFNIDLGCLRPFDTTNFYGVVFVLKTPDGSGGFRYQEATGVFPSEMFVEQDGLWVLYPDAISLDRFDALGNEILPIPPQTWEVIACSIARDGFTRKVDSNGKPTGPTVSIPSPDLSGSATRPPDVTITDGYARYNSDGKLELIVTWTSGSPYVRGVHAYGEPFDQSSTGTFTLGQSTLGSADGLHGEWNPLDYGRYTPSPFIIGPLEPVAEQTDKLVYVAAYTDQTDPKPVRKGLPGETPSIVITCQPPSTKGTPGREWAEPVLGLSVVASDVPDTAVKRTRLTIGFVFPEFRRPRGAYVTVELEPGIYADLGIIIDSGQWVELDTPTTIVSAKVWARSFVDPNETDDPNDDSVNSIVPGVTPMVELTLGTNGGTVDFRQALAESIASHLGVTSGVFGVLPEGITEDLVKNFNITLPKIKPNTFDSTIFADFGISNPQKLADGIVSRVGLFTDGVISRSAIIANATIQNAHIDRVSANKLAVVNADVVNLAAAKVTAGTLAAGVIYTGTINANQVNAGAFNGSSLTLNLNGVTTSIDNSNTDWQGNFVGVRVQHNTTGLKTLTSVSAYSISLGSTLYAYMATLLTRSPGGIPFSGNEIGARDTSGNDRIAIFSGNTAGQGVGLYINGLRVVSGRYGGSVTTLADVITALRAIGLIN